MGKTTLAVAAARGAAARGRRVLIMSTDPAHSLGDALGRRLQAGPRRVPTARGRLEAAELDPARALQRWLGSRPPARPGRSEPAGGRRAAFERALLRGTLLDRDDAARILRLAPPGLDELVALTEIERLAAARPQTDLVVVDTAPTGHTWRLLEAPETIGELAGVLDAMLARDRQVAAAVGGRAPRDASDALVEELAADARRLAARLRDPEKTRIVWITLAEPVAVAEALDAVAWLRDRGLPLAEIIVNRSAPAARSCAICRGRAALERAAIAPLRAAARGVPLGFQRDEPRAARRTSSLGGRASRPGPSVSPAARGAECLRLPATLKLLVIAGKGGVGKTTVAAAIAAAVKRRVLLLSTDPAHSLGDVLGVRLGDRAARVPGAGALEAREIDAAAALARERAHLRDAIDAAFDPTGGASLRGGGGGLHIDLGYDREVALRLLDLSPPGLDEIMALVSVIHALDRYDLIVLDTAPTGHALKLLEMPELAARWLSELMRILLKYRGLARAGTLAEPIVRMSRGVRRLQELLRDASQAQAVVVARAEELPRRETIRLLAALDRLGIRTAAVIVNAVTPAASRCARCRAARRSEAPELAAIARACARAKGGGCDIIVAPLVMPPPRGLPRLASWTRRWQCEAPAPDA